jgi:hypothetical protein
MMSASRAHKLKDASDGAGGSARANSLPTDSAPGEAALGPVPAALPADPALRAELFARLDRGIAESRAGRDVAWEDLDRRTRAKHGLPVV